MILDTGGAGFICSNCVIDWLVQHSEPVINLDKLTYAGNLENISSRSIHGPEDSIQTNIFGTVHLLEEVRGYWNSLGAAVNAAFRFLHVSGEEVYSSLGKEGAAPFTEKSPFASFSLYSASNASSDYLMRTYHHSYGLPVLTTNCSYSSGLYQIPGNCSC